VIPPPASVVFRAVPNEKITWGKLSVDTPKYIIESDATIVARSFLPKSWVGKDFPPRRSRRGDRRGIFAKVLGCKRIPRASYQFIRYRPSILVFPDN